MAERNGSHMRSRHSHSSGKTVPTKTGILIVFVCFVLALILFSALRPKLEKGTAQSGDPQAQAAEEKPDTTPPVIHGAEDISVEMGEQVSYRAGVTVTDDRDENVRLKIDSSGVDLTVPGEYEVIYTAADSSGNESVVKVKLTVNEAISEDLMNTVDPATIDPIVPEDLKEADVNELADKVLSEILKDGMSQRQKARAIFDYVYRHIKYVGTSDKRNWMVGAYVGFVKGKGDCYNYFACSKALLTRAGIPNVDLTRVGGATDHYWNLVDAGEGYYHFDACPHPSSYPFTSFMVTEEQVKDYTRRCKVRTNYYVYDYANCPVEVVQGTPVAPAPPAEEPPKEEPPKEPEPEEPAQTATPAAVEAPAEGVSGENEASSGASGTAEGGTQTEEGQTPAGGQENAEAQGSDSGQPAAGGTDSDSGGNDGPDTQTDDTDVGTQDGGGGTPAETDGDSGDVPDSGGNDAQPGQGPDDYSGGDTAGA